MTEYNGSIRNLLQGVSQQSRLDRRPEQLESQVNCLSSVTEGLGKRPGTQLLTTSTLDKYPDGAAYHVYDRGDTEERYSMVLRDKAITVLDLISGNEKAVDLNGHEEYLASTDPKNDFRFHTIADTTFILNRSVTPEMGTPTPTADNWQAIIYCARANWGFTYTVLAAGVTIAQVETPATVTLTTGASSTEQSKNVTIKTSDVIDALWSGATVGNATWVAGHSGGVQGWASTTGVTAQKFDDVIWLEEGESGGSISSLSVTGNKTAEADATTVTTDTVDMPTYTRKVNGTIIAGGFNGRWAGGDYHLYRMYVRARLQYYTNGVWYDGAWSGNVEVDGDNNTSIAVTTPTVTNDIERVKLQVSYIAPSNAIWQVYTGGVQYHTYAKINNLTATLAEGAAVAHEIEVTDSNHGTDMRTFGQVITKYSDLPRVCKHGYKVKVEGLDESQFNDFYVEFNAENGEGIGLGTWRECTGFGVDTEFVSITMPHILTREPDGSFLLNPAQWVARKAGDDDSNPKPSFVDRMISDIVTYQGRLVLISEENVCASVTFDHYNFFAETVQQNSPADPIDTASSDNQVTNLHHALVFNASLVLFSDRAQFVHPADSPFTSDTFGLSSKARFNNIIDCTPVASATSIFFSYNAGSYTGVRQFGIENVTGNVATDDITKHVDHYIEGSALQIDSSTDYNILVVRPDGDRNSLWVYQWFDQDGQRKQSAWHKWEFNTKIHHIKIIQDKMYVWFIRNGIVSIGHLDLADVNTVGCEFPVRLDAHQSIQAVSDGDYWQVDVSVLEQDRGVPLSNIIVLAGDDTGIGGKVVPWTDHPTVDYAVRVPKVSVFPVGTPSFIIGIKYEASGELTNPYVRDSRGVPKTKGKLRLQSMKFNCSDTGALDIEVSKVNSTTYTRNFDARIIGSNEFILDAPPPLIDAEIKLPIRSDSNRCSIKFKSDSHLPFYISSIDWSGSYYETGRRTI